MYIDYIKLFAKNERESETLIKTMRIYNQDIRIEFSSEKYTMLVMKSSEQQKTEGIKRPNQERIRTLKEKVTYKYLGILEADIKQEDTKKKKLESASH